LRKLNLVLLILFLFVSCVPKEPVQPQNVLLGKIVGVKDGDSVYLLHNGQQTEVRLAEIDCPEWRQPFGAKAKKALSDLIFNKEVKVISSGTDKYNRTIGRIYLGDLDVSAEMIRKGYAWAYRQYLTDKRLIKIEEEAKKAKRGIWLQPNPLPPWEFRHKK